MKPACVISALIVAVSILLAPIVHDKYMFNECVRISLDMSERIGSNDREFYRESAEYECIKEINE